MTLPDSNWTAAVIVGIVTGLIGWWQKRQLAKKVNTHATDIAGLKEAKEQHDLQISRLSPPAHEKHCSSAAAISRAMETQDRLHHPKYPHHKP